MREVGTSVGVRSLRCNVSKRGWLCKVARWHERNNYWLTEMGAIPMNCCTPENPRET